ncbi:hypothetical protein Dimus_009331 [Dionaea muscipula]
MKSPKHHLSSMMKKKSRRESSSSCHYVRLPCSNDDADHQEAADGTRKGYVPVMVGNELGVKEKFMVRTQYMTHPSIMALLQLSADEFGYCQQGVLQIPCEPDCFRQIISNLSNYNKT